MYKLHFKLKQHTPLIHFQHHQHGATLRATELKPKLDKFLIKKFKEQKINYENWLIKGQEKALDYKVRIASEGKPTTGEVEIMPQNNETWVLSQKISVIVFSFDKDLIEKIDELKNEFFALTNFGKRQSKGFGCFYPDKLKEDDFKNLIHYNNIPLYKSGKVLRDNIQQNTFFYDKEISPAWSRLKSGKNFRGYEKSRVFEYMQKNDLRWDKRWIKKELKKLIKSKKLPAELKSTKDPIDINNENSWDDIGSEYYRFGRAMLGLAEHYEYLADNKYTYQVKVKSSEIQRFKSPVTFKVFNKSLYAITEKIDKKMFETNFKFEVIQKINNKTIGDPIEISPTLQTPSKNKFNLETFLDDYFSSVGFSKLKTKN